MKIKICGLTRLEDIEAVNQFCPDYIGFVFARNSRRYINPEQAAKLKARLNPQIQSVGVFVDEPIQNIKEIVEKQLIDVVQLHGNETLAWVKELKKVKEITIIKAISMTEDGWKQRLEQWEKSSVDYLLLDSGNGGTGQQFDYNRIISIQKPFFLAGGINPDNAVDAVRQVNPFGIDMSSGVETNGKKDIQKIKNAIRRIRDVER